MKKKLEMKQIEKMTKFIIETAMKNFDKNNGNDNDDDDDNNDDDDDTSLKASDIMFTNLTGA